MDEILLAVTKWITMMITLPKSWPLGGAIQAGADGGRHDKQSWMSLIHSSAADFVSATKLYALLVVCNWKFTRNIGTN